MAFEATKTEKYRIRYNRLYGDSSDWRSHWKDLSAFILPRKGRYLTGNTDLLQTNDGRKKHDNIINGKATDDAEILAAGMQGGLTSPSRPWFRLALADEDLMQFEPVKDWLHAVRSIMLNTFARSNFYTSTHSLYNELGVFGTASMIIEEDFKTVIRCRPFTIGEYYLSLDSNYRPDTLYRQFALTARQLEQEFGKDNLSDKVKTALEERKQVDQLFEVIHLIEPNPDAVEGSLDPKKMLFVSKYFEVSGDPDVFLRESGYRSIPFVAPRWKITGVDTYGDSRAMDALGDIKMLQKLEEKSLKAIGKNVDPPMNAPTSMREEGGTIIEGGVNYVDVLPGQQGFTPTYQVNPDIKSAEYKIERVEGRIDRFFYVDLFLSVINQTKNMTAFEVAERQSEKLLMLGPVIERLQSELLDIIIERTFSILDDLGLFPPVPEEIAGKELNIEYISLLAQAQRAVATSSIEQTAGFASSLAAFNPEVMDKMDLDEAIDQFAAMKGVPPRIINTNDEVAKIRAARAEAAAEQANAEKAMNAVNAGKTLSETELNKDSMLDVLGESMQGASS